MRARTHTYAVRVSKHQSAKEYKKYQDSRLSVGIKTLHAPHLYGAVNDRPAGVGVYTHGCFFAPFQHTSLVPARTKKPMTR